MSDGSHEGVARFDAESSYYLQFRNVVGSAPREKWKDRNYLVLNARSLEEAVMFARREFLNDSGNHLLQDGTDYHVIPKRSGWTYSPHEMFSVVLAREFVDISRYNWNEDNLRQEAAVQASKDHGK